ncbi:hypothetical protein M434DRAFT_120991 [Hypoxylon sp. CO27-5]|nr:hypothetical protein M434DRAFT_120991 [Hypoxylon sp. CO27-5]
MVQRIRSQAAMTSTWISRTPGIPHDYVARHARMLNEITHNAVTAIHDVCRQRDDARREVQHYVQQNLHFEEASKLERDQLTRELNRMISRENGIKKEVERYRDSADKNKLELVRLERDAREFQQHHERMAEEWGQRDDQQFKHVQALEGELKRLRTRNAELAKKVGEEPEDVNVLRPDFSSPSVPESHKKNNLPSSPVKENDSHKVLLNMLNERYGNLTLDGKSSGVPFYNPHGPQWNAATSGTQRPPTVIAGNTKGNPSNWPAVVRRGNMAVAGSEAYAGPSGHAGTSVQPQLLGTSIARHKDNWELGDIVSAIDHLEHLIKGYIVKCHATDVEPPKVQNNMLPLQERATSDYILHMIRGQFISGSQAHNHMMYLLSVPAFRPYIIMRLSLDYLHKKIISPQLFLGMDDNLDRHLAALQDRISAFTRVGALSSSRERQIVINDHARIIKHAFQDTALAARMTEFRENSINYHAQVLSEILKPLRAMSVQDDAAFKSLRIMVAGTWDISSKVWMSGMTLHFLFPDCGCKFTDPTMKAINLEQFQASAAELQHLQARVCFVISPSLTVRDERDENNMICQHIRKSEVIIMK